MIVVTYVLDGSIKLLTELHGRKLVTAHTQAPDFAHQFIDCITKGCALVVVISMAKDGSEYCLNLNLAKSHIRSRINKVRLFLLVQSRIYISKANCKM